MNLVRVYPMLTVINEREEMKKRQKKRERKREPTTWGITSEEDKGKRIN